MSVLMNDGMGISQQAIIERLNECVNLVRSNSKRLEIESTLTNLNQNGEVLPSGFQPGHPNSGEIIDNDKINSILQVLTRIFSKIRKVKVNTYYDGNLKSSEITDKPIINLTVDSPDLIYGKVGGIGEGGIVDNMDIESRLNEIYRIWVSLPPIEQIIDVNTCRTENNGCRSIRCNSCRSSNGQEYGPDGLTRIGSRCYNSAADMNRGRTCKNGVDSRICKSNGCHGGKGGSNNGNSCRCRGDGNGHRSGCNCKSCRSGGSRGGSSGGKGGKR